jgi:hypothetical protein
MSVNDELIEEKVTAPVKKIEINGLGCSAKVGIKISSPVAVAQSVYFACRLKAMELFYSSLKFIPMNI